MNRPQTSPTRSRGRKFGSEGTFFVTPDRAESTLRLPNDGIALLLWALCRKKRRRD